MILRHALMIERYRSTDDLLLAVGEQEAEAFLDGLAAPVADRTDRAG